MPPTTPMVAAQPAAPVAFASSSSATSIASDCSSGSSSEGGCAAAAVAALAAVIFGADAVLVLTEEPGALLLPFLGLLRAQHSSGAGTHAEGGEASRALVGAAIRLQPVRYFIAEGSMQCWRW